MSAKRKVARRSRCRDLVAEHPDSPLFDGPAITSAFDAGRAIRCADLETMAAVLACLAGRAVHVLTLHDDGCSPVTCRCSADFVVRPLTVDGYQATQAAQTKWAKETLS